MEDCIIYKDATICELLDEQQRPTGEFCIIVDDEVVESGFGSIQIARIAVKRLRAKPLRCRAFDTCRPASCSADAN